MLDTITRAYLTAYADASVARIGWRAYLAGELPWRAAEYDAALDHHAAEVHAWETAWALSTVPELAARLDRGERDATLLAEVGVVAPDATDPRAVEPAERALRLAA